MRDLEFPLFFVLLAALAINLAAWSMPVVAQGGLQSPDGIWEVATDDAVRAAARLPDITGERAIARVNRAALAAQLARVPREDEPPGTRQNVVITLRLPNQQFGRFRLEEATMLAPELAAAFPEIKTYRGQGLDDPTATARLDWTADGLHAIVISSDATVLIDPCGEPSLDLYISYRKADVERRGGGVADQVFGQQYVAPGPVTELATTNGGTKRAYRLALAATGEYTAAAGGTKSAAVARMVTTMNRVNGIYERDLAIHFTMSTGTIVDPTALIYTDASTDPYTNSMPYLMQSENQTNLDAVIGAAGYDLGHVFAIQNVGGAAVFQATCSVSKGGGMSGNLSASGDYFDLNTVSHEMGHQLGANHTFNGTSGSCNGGRSAAHAFEPGGGSTPMAYNAVCSSESLQTYSGDYFHVESLNEITAFITSGGGSTCGTVTVTGNTPPILDAGASYTIPRGTPFTLTASGNDPNGDTLTYAWEEYDLGTASSSVPTASTDDGTRPLFRSYPPTTNPSRTFPSPSFILNNANAPPQTSSCLLGTCLTGETLPATNRTMTFVVTARDNRSGGGAIATASTHITSTTAAGPFTVIAPNTAVIWAGSTARIVTWNVANTTASPVNAANVKISLSTDGGLTFPRVLAASTPNSGSTSVVIPNTPTTAARVKVEAVGNIFFDVSDANFTITPGCVVNLSPAVATHDARGGGSTVSVTTNAGCSWAAVSSDPFLIVTGGASGSGSGSVGYSVASNTAGANVETPDRVGTISIGGEPFRVTQSGCLFGISPTGVAVGSGSGAGAVSTTTGAGCSWTVGSPPTWITTTSGGSGTGPGTWSYAVAANTTGSPRTQGVPVAGQLFSLTQLAAPLKPLAPGTRTSFTLPDNTAATWTSIEAVAHRSYCAQVVPGATAVNPANPMLIAWRANASTILAGATPGATTACFLAPATETVLLNVTQTDSSARPYRLTVAETTLWANWFFIGGDYSSFTLLRNTTAAALNATITWRSTAGAEVGRETVTLPSGAVWFRDALVATQGASAGSVEVAHDGHPQAVVGSQTTLSGTSGLSFDTIFLERKSR